MKIILKENRRLSILFIRFQKAIRSCAIQAGEVDYDGFSTNAETIEQLKELGFANVNVYTGSSYGYIKMNYKTIL